MEDKIVVNSLLDCYISLLTDKQIEICEMYYREDLSLQEIADILKISRAAVHDTIKRCKNELLKFEEKLHVHRSFQKRQRLYQAIKNKTQDQEIINLIDQCIKTEIEGE